MTEQVDHAQIENSPLLKPYYDDKRLFYRNAFWFLFGNSAAVFAQQTAQSLMPLHMASIKLDPQQISMIMAVSGWVGMPLLLYVSHLTDHWQWKFGRRLPFLALALPFLVVAMILFPYASSITSCLTIYTVYYIFNNIKSSTYPYLINDISKKEYWGRMSGTSVVAGAFGMWLGQILLMPMVPTHGEKLVFTIGAAFVFTATILTLVFLKEPPIRSETPPQYNPIPAIWGVLKFGFSTRRRVATCIAFGMVCGIGLTQAYVPLQAKVNLGLDEGAIGRKILQFGTFSNVLLAFVAGTVIDKLGTGRSMTIGYCVLVISAFLGTNPVWSADLVNSLAGTAFKPATLLSAAYIFNYVANPFIYTAALIFIMQSVHRKDVATFCACTGATNLLMQSCLMLTTGALIKHFFGGNYGFAFVMSISLVSLGIPLFLLLGRTQKHSASKDRLEPEPRDASPLQTEISQNSD